MIVRLAAEILPLPIVVAFGLPITAWTGRLIVLPVPAPTNAPLKALPSADAEADREPAIA